MSGIESIETRVYAGRIKDKLILRESSSGGAFTAISDVFLANGDAVVCATYNYDTHFVEYRLIVDELERNAARGSKYVQSIPGDVFKEAYDWIVAHPGKKLLFVGMGCQADGFRKFAEKMGIRDCVWVVDIICHGSPSPQLWKAYCNSFVKLGKIADINFRAKRKRDGWKNPTSYMKVGEKEYKLNEYMKVFYNGCALRPSCHVCPYTTMKRSVDMTIGDYWHIDEKMPDFYDVNGNSLFLIYTSRGMELFESILPRIEFETSNTDECWQKNLEKPTTKSLRREQFWNEYASLGVDFIMKKYGYESIGKKMYNKLKKIVRFSSWLMVVGGGGSN